MVWMKSMRRIIAPANDAASDMMASSVLPFFLLDDWMAELFPSLAGYGGGLFDIFQFLSCKDLTLRADLSGVPIHSISHPPTDRPINRISALRKTPTTQVLSNIITSQAIRLSDQQSKGGGDCHSVQQATAFFATAASVGVRKKCTMHAWSWIKSSRNNFVGVRWRAIGRTAG